MHLQGKDNKEGGKIFSCSKIDAVKRVLGLKCWSHLKKDVPFIWDDRHSFNAVKIAFASAPLLSPSESGGYFPSCIL